MHRSQGEDYLSFFFRNVYWLHSICCAICADRDGYSRVCVFPAGFGSNFRIMVGSASGPGSTFKAFLGSTRVRVPPSNKIRVRVGSAQHIYGSLRVRVRIFGPVKTSTSKYAGTICHFKLRKNLVTPLCTHSSLLKSSNSNERGLRPIRALGSFPI